MRNSEEPYCNPTPTLWLHLQLHALAVHRVGHHLCMPGALWLPGSDLDIETFPVDAWTLSACQPARQKYCLVIVPLAHKIPGGCPALQDCMWPEDSGVAARFIMQCSCMHAGAMMRMDAGCRASPGWPDGVERLSSHPREILFTWEDKKPHYKMKRGKKTTL